MAKRKSKAQKSDKGMELLAELLSYQLPGERARIVAAELILKFSSFSSVLNSRYEDIIEMGDDFKAAAEILKVQREAISFYAEDYDSNIQRVYDGESAYRILRPKFMGRKTEAVGLLLLDGRSRVLYNEIINEGSISEVPIYIRRIVQLCISYSAYDAIIAHNHPSGNPMPSKNDLNATSDLEVALNSIEVNLADHIIMAESDYLSLSSSLWLDKIKQDVKTYRMALREKTREEEAALQLWTLQSRGEAADKFLDKK